MKEKITKIKEKISNSQKNFLLKIKNFFPKKDNKNIIKTDDIWWFWDSENKSWNVSNLKISKNILDFHSKTKEKVLKIHKDSKNSIFWFFLDLKDKKIFSFLNKWKQDLLKDESDKLDEDLDEDLEEKNEKISHLQNNNILNEDFFWNKEGENLDENPERIKKEIGKESEKEVFKTTNEKNEIEKKEEYLSKISKNSFSEIFEDKEWKDIFSWVLKKKSSISISDNLIDATTERDLEKKYTDFFNLDSFKDILLVLNSHIFILLLFLISLFVWIYLFFIIIFDEKNLIFSYFWWETLWSIDNSLIVEIKNKEDAISKIESSIKKMAWDIPSKLYLNTPYFDSLSIELKNKILDFYDIKTWEIKQITKEEKNSLIILFNERSELDQLKNLFIKQDVLNSVINNRIYWKAVYKDLIDVTNTVFKYNNIINYVTYNNFSVDSEWKISVSWIVADPSWKVFSQLFRLEKAINESEHFSWVSIDNFNKTLNPDENVWWMMTSINLTFNYIK